MTAIENQTLALAGMFQCAALIEQLAAKGEFNQAAFDCSLDSLFRFDAETTLDVFGDLAGLSRGFKALVQYLGGEPQQPGKNIAYYVLSLLKIAAHLNKNPRDADLVLNGLQAIESQTREFALSKQSMISKLDGLYQSTISNYKPRIIVRGDQSFLSNSDNASKIRTLLFAGIRAAILWQQLGGSKWKLLFSRSKYVETARHLLKCQ